MRNVKAGAKYKAPVVVTPGRDYSSVGRAQGNEAEYRNYEKTVSHLIPGASYQKPVTSNQKPSAINDRNEQNLSNEIHVVIAKRISLGLSKQSNKAHAQETEIADFKKMSHLTKKGDYNETR